MQLRYEPAVSKETVVTQWLSTINNPPDSSHFSPPCGTMLPLHHSNKYDDERFIQRPYHNNPSQALDNLQPLASYRTDKGPSFAGDPYQKPRPPRSISATPQNLAARSASTKYDRRPRRKTREDRYEPWVTTHSTKRAVDPEKKEKGPTRKRLRRKAGDSYRDTVLDDNFKPSNILQDRLTVSVRIS